MKKVSLGSKSSMKEMASSLENLYVQIFSNEGECVADFSDLSSSSSMSFIRHIDFEENSEIGEELRKIVFRCIQLVVSSKKFFSRKMDYICYLADQVYYLMRAFYSTYVMYPLEYEMDIKVPADVNEYVQRMKYHFNREQDEQTRKLIRENLVELLVDSLYNDRDGEVPTEYTDLTEENQGFEKDLFANNRYSLYSAPFDAEMISKDKWDEKYLLKK